MNGQKEGKCVFLFGEKKTRGKMGSGWAMGKVQGWEKRCGGSLAHQSLFCLLLCAY